MLRQACRYSAPQSRPRGARAARATFNIRPLHRVVVDAVQGLLAEIAARYAALPVQGAPLASSDLRLLSWAFVSMWAASTGTELLICLRQQFATFRNDLAATAGRLFY